MTTEMTPFKSRNAALDLAMGSDIEDAPPLRYKEGIWLAGIDKTPVEIGTVALIEPASVQEGYVCWKGGRLVDQRFHEWANPNAQPIRREQLGDLDPDDWPDGRDPWAYTMLLAVKIDGRMHKFSTSTVGGANAIRKILRLWRRDRDAHPGLVPQVLLGSESYIHKVHHNTIKTPVFEMMGWDGWDGSERPPQDEKAQVKHLLNDSIPF
jgi:hypothetical protein